jgi:SAM-dependent methyltransferase
MNEEKDYKAFDKYYEIRSRILGLQNAKGNSIYKVIRREFCCAEQILDVGCGRGMYLVPLVLEGKNVTGLDFNQSNIELLKSHNYNVFCCDCVEHIPTQFHNADAILCAEVLEHLTREQGNKLIKNMHLSLRPGGKLVLTVPFCEKITLNEVVCPQCENRFHRYGHLQSYETTKQIDDQIFRVGFSNAKHYVLYPLLDALMLFPYWIHKLIRYIKPTATGSLVSVYKKH